MSTIPDESQLLEAACKGSVEAFGELVILHQAGIRACLVMRMDNPHEAEDLAQETFITAFRKLGEYDSTLPLAPWLRGIAFNLLRNHQKKKRPQAVGGDAELAVLLEQRMKDRYAPLQESAMIAALHECMATMMDGPSRSLLHRRYTDGATVHDIAKESKRGYSAVTMQLHRLRTLLGDCVKSQLQNQH